MYIIGSARRRIGVGGGGGGGGTEESFVSFSNKCPGPSKILNTYCGESDRKMETDTEIKRLNGLHICTYV
jgi:hypothetical protein